MFRQEVKAQPNPKEEPIIVEAFGNRKCPKLIEQVTSENAVTRRNALAVLCDEMHNPLSVQGCVDAGVVSVLNNYIAKSDDPETRERASRALGTAALDANGRRAMLEELTAAAVVPGIDDANVNVRSNVYEALVNFVKGPLPCLQSVIKAKYASTLVQKAGAETPEVQPLALKLLYYCIRDQSGLDDALGAGAVTTCLNLLAADSTDVRREAAATLCFLCFTEEAKQDAIKGGGVAALVKMLSDLDASVRSAACGALMAVTTTDEGKMACVPAQAGEALVELLASRTEPRSVHLHALKCVANVCVHPSLRDAMRNDDRVLATLDAMETGADTLVAKHASIAKAAVLWAP
jgi:hypothetical protein